MTYLLLVMLIVIIVSLGRGFYTLIRDPSGKARTVKALTWRMGLSISLFLILLIGYAFGWVSLHGVGG